MCMGITNSKNRICEAVECECKATEQIAVRAGKDGYITLFVCINCVSKFLGVD
jgi:hypothetical protein